MKPYIAIDHNLALKLFLNAPLGIARISKHGLFTEVNPKLCSMLGYSRDELLKLSVFDITHPDDLKGSYDRLKQIGSGEISGFEFEKRYIRKDGSLFWVRIATSIVKDGKDFQDFYVTTFEDISRIVQYQKILLDSEKKYQTILNTTLQGFWIVDFDARICEVNEAYCRMIGYSRDELLQMKISDLEADEDAEDIASRQAYLAKFGGATFITHHRRKDGNIISLSVVASYSQEIGNRIFAFFHDRTEIEETLAALNLSSLIAKEAKEAVMTISESTLRQIGQELHDDLGQILTGAAMISASLADSKGLCGEPCVQSDRLTGLLNEAIKRVRSVSHGLYPVELENDGLIPMIRSLVDRINIVSNVNVTLVFNDKKSNLDKDQSLHLYRIVQEALSNILRHSKATQASIKIKMLKYQIFIEIQDNGIGLKDFEQVLKSGVGLRSMQYRAEKIGAQLFIKERPKSGLLIEISLHLAH